MIKLKDNISQWEKIKADVTKGNFQSMIEKVKEQGLDLLREGTGEGEHGCDLHHELYNMSLIYNSVKDATNDLGADAFKAIGIVQQYENDNFGESNTDLSCPKKVANMIVYIEGEKFLGESDILRLYWDRCLNDDDIKEILTDLEEKI